MEKQIKQTRISLELGDITKCRVDAIVNAANPSLMGGAGVDGAIHKAGGPAILKECKRIVAHIGRLTPGHAVITNGGRLPARHVIHTVGPVWHGGVQREELILSSAYRESLVLADKMALKTIAFPSISTGAYGYPLDQAAEIAMRTVKEYIAGDSFLEQIIFILFSQEILEAYQKKL
jgi:O-acetyl-ADP-ribose deacetylase (regulator of RNase III)